MKRIKFLIYTLFVFLFSCGNYFIEKNKPLDSKLQSDQSEIDFSVIKESILKPNCISCHQQYENYSNVFRELSAIQNAIQSNRMPKSASPLSQNLKQLLTTWIEQGAPEKNNSTQHPPDIVALEPTWTSISQNTIFPKCLVCHNPNGQAKFLDLSSRQVIYDQRNRVFAEDSKLIDLDFPDKSYLLTVIADPDEPMPPLWSNIQPVTTEELKNIEQWITLGLPN